LSDLVRWINVTIDLETHGVRAIAAAASRSTATNFGQREAIPVHAQQQPRESRLPK
jgi:hypothetical protein